ncbi:efflux RND transporter periplasmic adaptor subunit [Hyphomicrobium methylovorum]|uniref:efflux RND transporter periplasmic adaptor subunit n=1 Tax=Hyphomicrobium methylovorum TaxID=84 RepID=UPI0015E73EA4
MRYLGLVSLFLLCAVVLPRHVHAHSDASSFASDDHGAVHSHHEREERTFYPATVVIDPQKSKNVVLKVNARITRLLTGFIGEKVSQGQVLAEFESAELATLQQTFIETIINREAMTAFSTTGEEKILEGRMNLRWRGLSNSEIDRIEKDRRPMQTVEIVSPLDGMLIGVNVATSQIVSAGSRGGLFSTAGTTLFRVATADALLVEAQMPHHIAAELKPGEVVELHIPGTTSSEAIKGTVETAVTQINPVNRTVTVRVRPDAQSAGALLSGTTLLVALQNKDREDDHHHGKH